MESSEEVARGGHEMEMQPAEAAMVVADMVEEERVSAPRGEAVAVEVSMRVAVARTVAASVATPLVEVVASMDQAVGGIA